MTRLLGRPPTSILRGGKGCQDDGARLTVRAVSPQDAPMPLEIVALIHHPTALVLLLFVGAFAGMSVEPLLKTYSQRGGFALCGDNFV